MSWFKNLILIVPYSMGSIVCFSSLSFAETNWKTSAAAEFRYSALYYPSAIEGTQGHEERLSVRAPISLRWKKQWRIRLQPLAEVSPGNSSSEERSYFELPEGFIQWQSQPITIQAGYNTLTWGATDVFNPLDIVNQHIYYDPLQSEKRGAPMLLVKSDFAPLQLEALYIPKQNPSLLPGTHSRWLPRDIYKTKSFGSTFGEARLNLPASLQYSYANYKELDRALSNNAGLRAQLALSGIDLSAIAFEGAATSPAVGISSATVTATAYDPILIFDVDPAVELQASYYRQRVYGGSAVVVLGQTILKSEAAFTQVISRRDDLPTRVQEYVLGLERNITIFNESITALLQQTYTKQNLNADGSATSLSRMFERATMLGLRYTPEKWTVLVSGLYDAKYKGNLIHAEISRKLSDACELKLTGDSLDGKQETPIGTYRKNSRAIAGLVYHL